MTAPESTTSEKRVVQLPLESTDVAMLTAFAGIGAGVVNVMQHEERGDLVNAARAEAAARETLEYALAAFESRLFDWTRWRLLNRRIAALAHTAFPEVPVQWHGDARPTDPPRPGE